MKSITSSNDAEALNDRFTYTKNQWRFLTLRSKFKTLQLRTLTGRSFRILNVCMVFKKSRARAREAWKMHFVHRGQFSCLRTKKLDLIMQKDSSDNNRTQKNQIFLQI